MLVWRLTFDMSGGPKGAKRPLERPLDGGVRCLRPLHDAFWQPERTDATLRGRIRRRQHRPQTLALRYPAGPRAAVTNKVCDTPLPWASKTRARMPALTLPIRDCTLPLVRCGGCEHTICTEFEVHYANGSLNRRGERWTIAPHSSLFRAPPAVSRPPTDGRPRQRCVRCSAANYPRPSASCTASCWRLQRSKKRLGA